MKTTLTTREFAAIKKTAQIVNPKVEKRNKLQAKIDELKAEYDLLDKQIELFEAANLSIYGYRSEDLVTKKITILDKTDKDGKHLTKTEYIPTDKVLYNEEEKHYIIKTTYEVPSNDGFGSDYDADKEKLSQMNDEVNIGDNYSEI